MINSIFQISMHGYLIISFTKLSVLLLCYEFSKAPKRFFRIAATASFQVASPTVNANMQCRIKVARGP